MTNKKETEMTMKVTRKEDVLTNQETSITITTNTILRFKTIINDENRRLELYNCDRVILREWITNVHVKKDDNNKTKLRDHEKENVSHRIRN